MTVGQIAFMALVRTKMVNGYEQVVDSLQLLPSFGAMYLTDFDPGVPDIEAAATPYTNISGSFDQSKYTRERAISVNMVILAEWFAAARASDGSPANTSTWDQQQNDPIYWVNQLARYAAPDTRAHLYVRYSGSGRKSFRIDIRGNGLARAIARTDRTVRQVQLNLISPGGLWQQFSPQVSNSDPAVTLDGRLRTVVPFDATATPTPTFPVTFPFTFQASSDSPATSITYQGTASTGMIVRVHAIGGAIYQPLLVFQYTDPLGTVYPAQPIGFQSGTATIPDGQYLEIDTNKMTVNLMHAGVAATLEPYLLGPLHWPQLSEGTMKVNLRTNPNSDGTTATAPGSGSYAEVLYYPAFN